MTLKSTWADGEVVHGSDLNAVAIQVNTNTTAITSVPADIAAAQLVTVNAQTANYTLVAGDAGKTVEVTKSTAATVTVPPNTSVALPVGTVIEVVQLGAGQVTLVAGSGVTLNSPSTLATRVQYSTIVIRKRATDIWLVMGDIG